MPGVNIAIKGTMVGTMTGADGTFTLSSIPGGKDAVLVFSFIGFRSVSYTHLYYTVFLRINRRILPVIRKIIVFL